MRSLPRPELGAGDLTQIDAIDAIDAPQPAIRSTTIAR